MKVMQGYFYPVSLSFFFLLNKDCVTALLGQVNHVTMFCLVFILLNKIQP